MFTTLCGYDFALSGYGVTVTIKNVKEERVYVDGLAE